MRLFNASSLFTEESKNQLIEIIHDPEKLKEKLNWVKRMLLQLYRLQAFQVPEDFTTAPYIIATNHLTDSDAPLLISFNFKMMEPVLETYPELFVFAKENCFNGVSIPTELMPMLNMEKVVAVDRNSASGSMAAMKEAKKWFKQGEEAKHFLIFSQGTIYDINKDKAEDIEPGAFWLSRMLGIPVLPAFLEQAVEGQDTRLVFAEPISVPKNCRDFIPYQQLWIDRVIGAQNQLETLTGTPARPAVLDADHQTRKRFR